MKYIIPVLATLLIFIIGPLWLWYCVAHGYTWLSIIVLIPLVICHYLILEGWLEFGDYFWWFK